MKKLLQTTEYALLGSAEACRSALSFRLRQDSQTVAAFDTAIGSRNLGDRVIMDACERFLESAFPDKPLLHLPVHTLPTEQQLQQLKQCKYRFLCGTNLLTSHIETWWNWQLPPGWRGKRQVNNVILLGVGWNRYEDPCSPYTRLILRTVLNPCALHAVRDSYTYAQLRQAGFSNAVNTGCVTMWGLTPEFCRSIPAAKANAVITTLTDYRTDPEADQRMLDILGKGYQQVRIWPQGSGDEAYLKTLHLPGNATVLPGNLEAFNAALRPGQTDYVGTRLHAGIHALNHGVRSLIIGVDNRALEIGKDTALPVLPRAELGALDARLRREAPTEILLPWENIRRFREQFTAKEGEHG